MQTQWNPIYDLFEEEQYYYNHMVARKHYLKAIEKHKAGLLSDADLNSILSEENIAFSKYMRFRAL